MDYTAKNYTHLLGTQGFSDDLLTTHFGLYEGYVHNTNKALQILGTEEQGTPQWAEVKRRFGWEFNGMRLHELYFDNMTKEPQKLEDHHALVNALEATFTSVDAWRKEFVATGSLRGIGWAILAKDTVSGNLINIWINEHDVGHLAGTRPLLIMDVFEHAFVKDYGMKRAEYIDAFMHAVNWAEVEKRLT